MSVVITIWIGLSKLLKGFIFWNHRVIGMAAIPKNRTFRKSLVLIKKC